jgi:hypothetical protein
MPASKRVRVTKITETGPETDIQPIVPMPSVNLFTRKGLQMSVQSTKEEEVLPTGNWEGQSEIMFDIRGDPEMLIDPSSLVIQATLKVVNGDGGDLGPLEIVAPAANFAGALFEKVQVRLGNSTQICGFDSLYPYLTYLENVLKAPDFVQKQLNFPTMLYRDTDSHFDEMDDTNAGFEERREQTIGSIPIKVQFPILSPITTQDKLLPPNVGLFLDMHRAKDSFLIMSAQDHPDQKVELGMLLSVVHILKMR